MCKRGIVGTKSDEVKKISVALAGNPNVGKSTLFNSLTGMHRHTGNWAGKTVDVATSDVKGQRKIYSVADIPGTYSLLSHSHEEEVARNYICFGGADITVVVCDATSLEHSLTLVLQISEVTKNLIVCVNLMDEAERRGIKVDTHALEKLLGVPVIGVVARKKRTLRELVLALDNFKSDKNVNFNIDYPETAEHAVAIVESALKNCDTRGMSHRWVAMRLIESDDDMNREISEKLGIDTDSGEVFKAVSCAREYLFNSGVDLDGYKDIVVGRIISSAEKIAGEVVKKDSQDSRAKERKIDKILTGRFTAFPVMILLLGLVLFITMFLANYPSDALSRLFSYIETKLAVLLRLCNTPEIIADALIYGIYRTTTTVVAVMLPPMAIFFPLFTLLEDSGYLPRVAYNLDRPFAVCGACGKQALTMCMGLGCNAVGISGARIIDSKRERLLSILTNALVPCNGRLPMLVSIIGAAFIMFFGRTSPFFVASALLLLILLSVLVTFLSTFILSKTILSGERSSFTIELPPYRRPEIIRVVFRSLTTKVCSVLLRAVAVAAPMGLLIFILSNISVGDGSLISYVANILNPIGKFMGLDGAILLAFVLGIPANEIVVPILIMIYTSGGVFGGDVGIYNMSEIFANNGWCVTTAVCMALFALFHWPCSTSIITVYKETHSKKYTLIATVLPTVTGIILCALVNLIALIF